MTNENTLRVLKAATAGIRAEYVARYSEMMLARLVADRAGLAAVGFDAQIYAPYPNGGLSREAYRSAERKYYRVRASFNCVKGCRSHREPEIVVEKPEAEPKLRTAARAEADALVDGYLHKLAGKIGKEVVSASTNGNIWDSARLSVECADGEKQVWDTQCILNCSVLGKLFNQWPTRRVKLGINL